MAVLIWVLALSVLLALPAAVEDMVSSFISWEAVIPYCAGALLSLAALNPPLVVWLSAIVATVVFAVLATKGRLGWLDAAAVYYLTSSLYAVVKVLGAAGAVAWAAVYAALLLAWRWLRLRGAVCSGSRQSMWRDPVLVRAERFLADPFLSPPGEHVASVPSSEELRRLKERYLGGRGCVEAVVGYPLAGLAVAVYVVFTVIARL